MRRCLPVLLLALALGATACASEPQATRDETGAVAGEGAVDAFAIQVGDCFNEPAGQEGEENELIESIAAVPCDQAHDGEVFHDFQVPDGDFPGQDALLESADQQCLEAFAGFVGVPFEDSTLEAYPITPTEESWNGADDRAVSCVVYDPEAPVTGSLRGAER